MGKSMHFQMSYDIQCSHLVSRFITSSLRLRKHAELINTRLDSRRSSMFSAHSWCFAPPFLGSRIVASLASKHRRGR